MGQGLMSRFEKVSAEFDNRSTGTCGTSPRQMRSETKNIDARLEGSIMEQRKH